MDNMTELLQKWQLDLGKVRNNVYRSATPRERERWHALWLVARGWTAAQFAEALERDPHTIGERLDAFRQADPEGLVSEQAGGAPRLGPGRAGAVESGCSGYAGSARGACGRATSAMSEMLGREADQGYGSSLRVATSNMRTG